MIKVYLVVVDAGDGSSYIQWFKEKTLQYLYELEQKYPNQYSSGDGLQFQELVFPESFDLEMFASVNHINWADNFYDEDYEF